MKSPVDEEQWLAEIVAVLQGRFTVYVEAMTLTAAVVELLAWIDDRRQFIPVQHNDWQSILADVRSGYSASGPKLQRVVDLAYRSVESHFAQLFTSSAGAGGNNEVGIDEQVRDSLRHDAAVLRERLRSDAAIDSAWLDLHQACVNRTKKVEDIEFKRKTLWAIAEARHQNTDNGFGLGRQLSELMRGYPLLTLGTHDGGNGPVWRRSQQCQEFLMRPPAKADCIVWLRLEPALMHEFEVTHGQVTFYSAQLLASCVGHPELACNFTVIPHEVLNLPADIQEHERRAWSEDPGLSYARVLLPDAVVHLARKQASTLVAALVQISDPHPGTWIQLDGSMLFIDGTLRTWEWGPKARRRDYSRHRSGDAVARRIQLMVQTSQSLSIETTEQLAAALALSNALTRSRDDGSEATVMAAVRAIEHVNAWAVGGRSDWAQFACKYFKQATSRAQLVAFLGEFTSAASTDLPDSSPDALPPPEDLDDIKEELWTTSADVDYFDVNGAIDHLPRLREIYQRHWLRRALADMEAVFRSGKAVVARLNLYDQRFDTHLSRLKRIRNAAIHGGPVTPDACESIATFAYHLGHYCLNQVIEAHLTATDITTYMNNFRAREQERRQKVELDSDYDELFVPTPI
ncbi:hypothetical protein [Nocardia caishijiensis]|uniref:Apea-like HEPN domain-containing protein n=1 Tax=Nocardia caishijiensis TaxID=184756 RepID=A0ABQ6YLY4_9NOCA|nr:hypothetical protein [Nocardia caishijiensis]KAF0846481.1 hypothetical protein FNL39_105396 [Nocardia caishijiensis]